MVEHAGRTIICSVVFIDIVRYSEAPDSLQLAMKARLNGVIAEAVARTSEQERVILDTGDGAAICFLGDPEDALFAATAINDAVGKETGDSAQTLRTGINLGPIKRVTDLNGRTNVVGDGINVAQRVMSFADEGEILVSRSFYEVVARLREGNERLFRYMGSKRDKHVREHQLYAFGLHAGASHPCQPATVPIEERVVVAAPPSHAAAISAELAVAEERRLARYIGPLAKVLVRRAAESAQSVGQFCTAIAAAIPDAADRASFLAGAPVDHRPRAVAPPPPSERPEPSPAVPVARSPAGPASLSEDEVRQAERRLASHLGPLAGVLVRKAAKAATSRQDLYARLGASIADDDARAAFLATAEVDA